MSAGSESLPAGSRFHHIGLACRDIDGEVDHLRALGYEPVGAAFRDPVQGVSGLFLEGLGPRIELLAPLEGSSVLEPWLAGRARMYHLAYEVDELEQAVEAVARSGARTLGAPVPAVAFDGRRTCFLMLRNLFLAELIETREPLP